MPRPLSTVIVLVLAALMSIGSAQAPGRAYRSINFGDSFSEVARKILSDDGFTDVFGSPMGRINTAPTPEYFLSWNPRIYTAVGDLKYLVDFEFYDDKLYRMRFESPHQSATLFDTFVQDHHINLVTVIEQARGRADVSRSIRFSDVNPYHIVWSHMWNTRSDGVAHYVGIGEHRYEYYAGLWIEWTWLRQFKEEAEGNQVEELQRRSSEDF